MKARAREQEGGDMPTTPRNKVLLRSEESGGAVAIAENTMPAGAPGPPLHSHAFDEAFYVLDGELTFQMTSALDGRQLQRLTAQPATYRRRCWG
jgi:quercetin dioxygenase-like cupin family protein